MQKIPKFPCLPGYNFNHDIGRTKFHKSQQFDRVSGKIYFLADKPKDPQFTRYPAIYAWGELPPSPPWLTHDRQRLMFYGYFQENCYGQREPYRIRKVKISFFLEDGTMKVVEPQIENCGMEQGLLVRRQRIPLPDPVHYRYYDILDLNIGKEPEIFGRVYKIIDCDIFTRKFLNRMGIPVPDPLEEPKDPYKENKLFNRPPLNCKKKIDTVGGFRKYGQLALRFFGYWDDTESLYGYIHDLEVLYCLADGRMEVYELVPGRWQKKKKLILKKTHVPKFFEKMEPVGSADPLTLLNVLGKNINKSVSFPDSAYCENKPTEYYKECDLVIGAQLNIFGRKVVLIGVDEFTQEYYRKKYGIEDFTPLERPKDEDVHGKGIKFVPPYNGYGSYEDSLSNCFNAIPKRPKFIIDKYFVYENQTNDDIILRFGAKMISDNPINNERYFLLEVFVMNNSVQIIEVSRGRNSVKNVFLTRMQIRIPGQEYFSSEPPKYFEPRHFYIGATLPLNGFKFQVETADEFTLNYMERHINEFPYANAKLALSKVKENIKPNYLEFTSKYCPYTLGKDPPSLTFNCFREAINTYVKCLTDHEIITLARHYAIPQLEYKCPREFARTLVHFELIKQCWNHLDRLQEDIYEYDKEKSGFLNPDEAYTLLRASKLPIPTDLVHLTIDCLCKNEKGQIDCEDLIDFFNLKLNPPAPITPKSLHEMHWRDKMVSKNYDQIDWCRFIKDLGLEEPQEKAD